MADAIGYEGPFVAVGSMPREKAENGTNVFIADVIDQLCQLFKGTN
jgi:hypothetical protein